MFPGIDVLGVDGDSMEGGVRSPRRHELLHALREAQEAPPTDTAAWMGAPVSVPTGRGGDNGRVGAMRGTRMIGMSDSAMGDSLMDFVSGVQPRGFGEPVRVPAASQVVAIEGMVGSGAAMMELARLIRLVAPRSTSVLIQGETGSGKEVVAKAVHRHSVRSTKAFVVLNCAAIPEALLEAELFGHTRGAFTGAVQSRTGRIEAANGGTLFLDEIGEMPLPLQAKMLRFLECGELQRVGDNETMRVDVRVIAATHQHLEKRSAEGTFRLDLYHRLAVFPVEVPSLREHAEDIPLLVEHFLAELGKEFPRKRVSGAAMEMLMGYSWPGNVRELAHVLERGAILAGDAAEIGAREVRFKSASWGG
jgi:transcriptional regulator with GAF, ATPase, and Fis domain